MEKATSSKGMNWKEFKLKKKEEYKKWKEDKLKKKQKKLEEKSKLDSSLSENNLTIKKDYTVSIAVPGNILDNAQSPELKTYLAGQIARAAAIFNVNEIIVFSEIGIPSVVEDDFSLKLHQKNHGCIQLVRILQYLECPQYLRKYYFPIHKDLEYAGLLNPLDLPHHLRVDDESEFREGIVMNKPVKQGSGSGSFVYIGLQKTAVIDRVLESNLRVTVQLDKEQHSKKHFKGKAISPSFPYKYGGIYWGYSVRLANNLNAIFSESIFKGGYDVVIGTSDKGSSIDSFKMPPFKHLLIVFGGLKGLEAVIENDETLEANEPKDLFPHYLNTCPNQGSRTIRTEIELLKGRILKCKQAFSKIKQEVLEEAINDLPDSQKEAIRACFKAVKAKNRKGYRYTLQWVYECLLIKIKSRKTYEHLRNNNILALPSIQTLNKYIEKVKGVYGFQSSVFSLMSQKAENMNEKDKRGVLILDEMKITSKLNFNRKAVKVEGFTDLGDITPSHLKDKKGDHALVFMFQPFRGKWSDCELVMAEQRYGTTFILQPACLYLRQLPNGTDSSDIKSFLGQLNIKPRAIHIIVDPNKLFHPQDEAVDSEAFAFVELECYCHLTVALSLNRQLIRNKHVYLQAISYADLCKALVSSSSPFPVDRSNV